MFLIKLRLWDVSNVAHLGMFVAHEHKNTTFFGDISGWDVSNWKTCSMFLPNNFGLRYLSLGCSNVIHLDNMFNLTDVSLNYNVQ